VFSTRPRRSAPRPAAALKITIARKLLTRAWHLLNDVQAADAATPLRRP
jgi:hypothetical protein